jgi:hypothetical protein
MSCWVLSGIESEAPAWEPEPYELPLVEPIPRRPPPLVEELPAEDADNRVVVIDLA